MTFLSFNKNLVRPHIWKVVFFNIPLILLASSTNYMFLGVILSVGLVGLFVILERKVSFYVAAYFSAISFYLVFSLVLYDFSVPIAFESSLEFMFVYFFSVVLPQSFVLGCVASSHPNYLVSLRNGFIVIGLLCSLLVIVSGDKHVLGYGRYQWGGNLSAIAFMSIFFLKVNLSYRWLLGGWAMVGVLLFTSRQSMVIIVVGLFLLSIIVFRKWILFWLFLVFSWIVVLFKDYFIIMLSYTVIGERFLSLGKSDYVDEEGRRLDLMGQALDSFINNWFVGIGPREFINSVTYSTGKYPHNIIVEVLVEYGVVGFLFIVFPILLHLSRYFVKESMLLGAGKRIQWNHNLKLYAFVLATSFFTIANISGDLLSNRGLFITFAIFLGVSANKSMRIRMWRCL